MPKVAILSDEEILRKALPEDAEIAGEYDRLLKLFTGADEKAVALERKTIARAAFLAITVDRLERDVAQNGYKEAYQNGATQTGYKKSVAADMLPNYPKLYLACMKELREALDTTKPMEPDELEVWLKEHGDEFDRF